MSDRVEVEESLWCGPRRKALLADSDDSAMADGCPRNLDPKLFENYVDPDVDFEEDGRSNYRHGLYYHSKDTTRFREAGDQDTCCYSERSYYNNPHVVIGRPLVIGDRVALARSRRREEWCAGPTLTSDALEELDAQTRERLAELWLEDALEEHGAVAAFARAALELLALGAPPELVAGYQRAGFQEVRHAQSAFAIASALAGRPLGPDVMPVEGPRPELRAIAVDSLVGGCIGESIAALCARRAARCVEVPRLRDHLEMIADEEAGHAALAFSTVAWALRIGDADLRDELAALADSLGPHAIEDDVSPAERELAPEVLARFGRLGPEDRRRACEDAWREIVAPTLDEIFEHARPV